jgi:hypothetical protein
VSTLVITRLATSTTIDRTPTPIVVSRQFAGVMGATGPIGPPGTQPVFTRTGSLDTATGTTPCIWRPTPPWPACGQPSAPRPRASP